MITRAKIFKLVYNVAAVFGIIVPMILTVPVALADTAPAPSCAIADTAIHDVSRIRQLKIKGNVPCLVRDKTQIKEYLLQEIAERIPPKKLQMEALVYRALGLIPEEYDYAKGIVDLYMNQIGGYYDPKRHHYVMAAWIPTMLQTTIAVHELTHALQDQYFDLRKFIDDKSENSDELLARTALVEGDATAVMMDYARGLMGQGPIAKEQSVESIMLQNVMGVSLMAGKDVPQSLQLIMIFPYTSGLRFAHHLLRQGGYIKADEAFKQPPRTTEEILHPEKYLSGKADFVTFEDSSLGQNSPFKAAKSVFRDTMGEFVISALLSTHLEDKSMAAQAAAGWGGDRVGVYENALEKPEGIIWKTYWDTDLDAQEFYSAYIEVLKKRFPKVKDSSKFANGFVPVTANFELRLSKSGQEVDLLARFTNS